MSSTETFFTFGFISTLAVALLATGYRYLPTLVARYIIIYQRHQPISSKSTLDNLKFHTTSDGEL